MSDADKKTCLVLMPFAPRFAEVHRTVYRPCCEALGLHCWRVDEAPGPGSISQDIIDGIYDADLLIADLTSQNPNVFYEVGIAHTFGKEVVLTTQSTNDVPFDIRNHRVLLYEQTDSGAERFRQDLSRALATVLNSSRLPSNPVQDALRLRSLSENPLIHEHRVAGRLVHGTTKQVPARPNDGFETRMEAMRLETSLARVASAIEQIINRKTREDKLLIVADKRANIYIQFSVEEKGKEIYGEAVSNYYLEPEAQLSSEQMSRLRLYGWQEPDGEEFLNFYREWKARDSHDARLIALEVARTLSEVYGIRDLAQLEIEAFE